MHSSTFGKGWVGMSACPLVVLACESLHVCTVCIWRCEHARFCVEVFYALYINFHSFIHSSSKQGVIIEASSEVFTFSLLPVDKVCNSVDLLDEEMVDGDLQ